MSIIEEKNFLFIVGAPRSGTTLLQILLASHPQVATTVELTLFDSYLAPLMRAWKREAEGIRLKRWDQGLPFIWSEAEFYNFLQDFLEKAYAKVLELKPAATHILDKHPAYSFHVGEIKQLIPQARFIHIIRDGRDVASSMVAAHHNMGFGTATLADSAADWKKHVSGARKAAQFSGDYIEVRYEDILTRGVDALGAVLDFCRLPYDRAALAATIGEHSFERMKERKQAADPRVNEKEKHYRKGKAGTWREEFSGTDRYLFDCIAGQLLRELGYAKQDWWIKSFADRLALPLRHALVSRLDYLVRGLRAVWNRMLFSSDRLGKVTAAAPQSRIITVRSDVSDPPSTS